MTLANLLLVALGSALGGIGRYAVALALPYDPVGGTIPVATLLVNLAGSLAIGLVSGLALPGGMLAAAPQATLLLGAGLLGGFTTFSAFSAEAAQMLADGEPYLAFAYITLSAWGCVGFAMLGLMLGSRI